MRALALLPTVGFAPPPACSTVGRLYLRIAADLHMCLSHPAVVLALLAGPQAPLFNSHFLEVLRLIEGASPFRCAAGAGHKTDRLCCCCCLCWRAAVQAGAPLRQQRRCT